MPSFANRVVLVTGAGSGLGRQLALGLAREGAAVAVLDLKAEPLEALAAELPGKRVAWAVGDVRDRATLRDAVTKFTGQLGPVDVLIANAGIGIQTSGLDFRAEDIEAQTAVNLVGVANSFGAVLPDMLRRRQGQLVAISSLASYRGLPRMFGYCASKAGVNALLDGLRVELKPHGIAVTTICPGWIRTPLTTGFGVPQRHLMDVGWAAERILDAIHRRRRFYAFPPSGVRLVRLLKWLPLGVSDWLTAQIGRRYLKD